MPTSYVIVSFRLRPAYKSGYVSRQSRDAQSLFLDTNYLVIHDGRPLRCNVSTSLDRRMLYVVCNEHVMQIQQLPWQPDHL